MHSYVSNFLYITLKYPTALNYKNKIAKYLWFQYSELNFINL